MADGRAALDAHIRRIRELPGLVDRAAPEVARAVERELQLQIRRGETPSGRSWKLRADGGAALVNAGKALTVRVVGKVVLVRLEGPEARHHLGAVRGGVRRQILPTASIPEDMAEAIGDAFTREFRRTMGGR